MYGTMSAIVFPSPWLYLLADLRFVQIWGKLPAWFCLTISKHELSKQSLSPRSGQEALHLKIYLLRQREAGFRAFASRKYNQRSSSISKVFPTEKPMGSSRDILPKHTKSGKQPKVALSSEWTDE